MVGAPRNISDLDKLDANPVVTCRLCVWSVEYDRASLISVRLKAGLGTTWEAFCGDTRCEACGGPVKITMRLFVSDTALRKGDLKRQLVFKALCVLTEAMRDAERGKVRPSLGLRFALAYLYAVGERRREWFDREPYVEFWQFATKDGAPTRGCQTMSGSARGTQMRTCINAIGRAAGVEITADVNARLGKAVGHNETIFKEPTSASNDR